MLQKELGAEGTQHIWHYTLTRDGQPRDDHTDRHLDEATFEMIKSCCSSDLGLEMHVSVLAVDGDQSREDEV